MPDNGKLIAQAQTQAIALTAIAKEFDTLSKAIKIAVEATVTTITAITTAATNADKALLKWGNNITEAKKTQGLIDKVKEAAAAAKNLKEATTKAEKLSLSLKNEADMARRIADKSGKEDAAIGAKLKIVMDEAEKSLSRMQTYAGPGGDFVIEAKKALDQLLVGKNTPPVVRDVVRVVSEDLKDAGEDLTTAESVYKNMPPVLKPALEAYIPEVRKKAQDGQALYVKLGGYISKSRSKLGTDLTVLKGVQEKLKTFK
jgi:hypothetical protein